jgi:hypothetical protein
MRTGPPTTRRGLAARLLLPVALPTAALWALIGSGPALSLTQGQAYETAAATGTPYETAAATGTPYETAAATGTPSETEAATASGTELAATPTVPTETATPANQATGSVGAATPGTGGVPGLTPPSTDVPPQGVGSHDEVLTMILIALALATVGLLIARPTRRRTGSYQS